MQIATLFEQVSAHNGWNMAFTGMVIVFSCLVILALFISRIHKVLDLLDNRDKLRLKAREFFKGREKEKQVASLLTPALELEAVRYRRLTPFLGESFSLKGLIRFAEGRGITTPPPEKTVRQFLEAGLIKKEVRNLFTWTDTPNT
ncbi:MAG: OadG family protein [Desulfobacterales bacterium]|nr:OadG family protein [Desulfobacterales bacterium]